MDHQSGQGRRDWQPSHWVQAKLADERGASASAASKEEEPSAEASYGQLIAKLFIAEVGRGSMPKLGRCHQVAGVLAWILAGGQLVEKPEGGKRDE